MLALVALLAATVRVREALHVEVAPGAWLHAFLHGEDASAPPLLFIIGGQGTPAITFEPKMRALSEHFVYATYTMRGVMGINGTAAPDGVAQHVDDAVWMTRYLSRRCDGRRVIVSGLSYGADMALQVAARAPEAVAAVLSISGFFDVPANLARAHEHIHARVPRPLVWLSELLGDEGSWGYIYKLYLTGIYGIISYDCHATWPCLPSTLIGPMDVLGSPFSYAVSFALRSVPQMSACIHSFRDVRSLVAPAALAVPVYFFRGRHDLLANADIAEAYAARLAAPRIRTRIFERSSHFIPLEENAAFHEAMREVATWALADQTRSRAVGRDARAAQQCASAA